MADIAMLVAEEYERRMKMVGGDEAAAKMEMGFLTIQDFSRLNWIAKLEPIGVATTQVLEPRTRSNLSLQALCGRFSA